MHTHHTRHAIVISCLISYTSSPKIWLTGETTSYLTVKWRDEVLKIGKFSNSADVNIKLPNKHKTECKIVFQDTSFPKAPQAYQSLRLLHLYFIFSLLEKFNLSGQFTFLNVKCVSYNNCSHFG